MTIERRSGSSCGRPNTTSGFLRNGLSERSRFVLPLADGSKLHLTAAQLSMLLEGID